MKLGSVRPMGWLSVSGYRACKGVGNAPVTLIWVVAALTKELVCQLPGQIGGQVGYAVAAPDCRLVVQAISKTQSRRKQIVFRKDGASVGIERGIYKRKRSSSACVRIDGIGQQYGSLIISFCNRSGQLIAETQVQGQVPLGLPGVSHIISLVVVVTGCRIERPELDLSGIAHQERSPFVAGISRAVGVLS